MSEESKLEPCQICGEPGTHKLYSVVRCTKCWTELVGCWKESANLSKEFESTAERLTMTEAVGRHREEEKRLRRKAKNKLRSLCWWAAVQYWASQIAWDYEFQDFAHDEEEEEEKYRQFNRVIRYCDRRIDQLRAQLQEAAK